MREFTKKTKIQLNNNDINKNNLINLNSNIKKFTQNINNTFNNNTNINNTNYNNNCNSLI